MDVKKESEQFYQSALKKKKQGDSANTSNQAILQESNVSIILDSYNDIFSDFDPRAYSERNLSDDFLPEVKRVAKERPDGSVQLRLFVPADKRNYDDENLIKKRLKEHFRKHKDILERDIKKTRMGGLKLIFIGSIVGVLATLIYDLESSNFFIKFLSILLEPASWFTIWSGFDNLFFGPRQFDNDLDFYKKMSRGEVFFLSY